MKPARKEKFCTFRSVDTPEDGARMWQFVREHGVLELNSAYCYLLMAAHFGTTCLLAEQDDKLVGFILGHRPPNDPTALFVWQIGVHPDARGRGLAKQMLGALLDQPGCADVTHLTATVAADNEPSRALFRGFARDMAADCIEKEYFTSDLFPEPGHSPEDLFRIGPLQRKH